MEWKSPGQRHHANMREAAGAEEGEEVGRQRPALGRGKMLQAK